MRSLLFLPLLVLCCSCSVSVVPSQAWTFDPGQLQPRTRLAPEELAPLTARVAQLQLQRNEIRSRIAAETDVWQRQRQYAELHVVGMELAPLERRLSGIESAH